MKYFKSIEHVHSSLIGKENLGLQGELLSSTAARSTAKGRQMFVQQLLSSGNEGESSADEEDDGQERRERSPTKRRRTSSQTIPTPLPRDPM